MSEFGKVFKKYSELSQVKPDEMSLQEMFEHRFELIRLQELGLKLLDDMEKKVDK